MLEKKALWVLKAMVQHPSEVELVEFFPYRKGLVTYRHEDAVRARAVIVDYSGSGLHYGGREAAGWRFADKINRLENVVLGRKRDNHICMTVRFRGREHAMRFSDCGCTLVLDSKAKLNLQPY